MIKKYKELVNIKKYRVKGIFHSELYLFWTLAKSLKVNRIVESGTFHGFTANRLARLFPECEIYTYEYKKDRYDKALRNCNSRVKVFHGELDQSVLTSKTALLIDGPKDMRAIRLTEDVIDKVAMVGLHDMDIHIDALTERFGEVVHSGVPEKAAKKLDKFIPKEKRKYTKGYYGRVLACVWEKKG